MKIFIQNIITALKSYWQRFSKHLPTIPFLKKTYHFFFKKHKIKTLIALGIFTIWYIFFALPRPLFQDPTSIVLEDRNGELLGAKIAKDGQWRFPKNNAVPEKFEKAIIEFEDRRFYYHLGIDPLGIVRAFEQNIRNRSVVSGGSTLSMQVIRMSRKGKQRSLWQKVIEMIKATRLELGYSKAKILALYASNAPFGGNVVGLDAASWRYYGKKPDLLSWGEAATLAVLPNAPSLIHPGKNRDLLLAKRNRLLDRLLASGTLDSLSCELAKTEPLPEKPLPLPRLAPHLLDRVHLEHFKNSEIGTQTKLRSSVEQNLQKQVNSILYQHHQHLAGNGIHNLAAMVMDVESGEVLAYVGNMFYEGNKDHGHAVDIITAPRSTGSIIKPFLYAMAHQEGQIIPTALVPDIPTQMKNYRPLNFNETFDGAVPAKRALARSLNVPIIRILQEYGLEKFHRRIKKLGMTTIKKPAVHYGLPLVLGGAECTLWDVTGIYASMARTLNHFYNEDGLYDPLDFRPPHYLADQAIKPSPRRKMLKEAPQLSAAAIWTAFDAMLEVERPLEDGSWELFDSRRMIAWKTGTSFGFRDAWSIGVNPKYAVGVWVGNADGEGRPGLVGVKAAAPILFDIFNTLETPNWFDPPYDEMVEIPVCKMSGYRAKDICEAIDTTWAPVAGLNAPSCPYHQLIHTDSTQTYRMHGNCESPSNMAHIPWFVLPPVEEYYFKSRTPTYKLLPPYRADCLANLPEENHPMQIIYPKPNAKIYVPTDLDGTLEKTVFRVAHRNTDATIYWHIDNTYLDATQDFHELALQPEVGKHTLTLVDKEGFRAVLDFEILGK